MIEAIGGKTLVSEQRNEMCATVHQKAHIEWKSASKCSNAQGPTSFRSVCRVSAFSKDVSIDGIDIRFHKTLDGETVSRFKIKVCLRRNENLSAWVAEGVCAAESSHRLTPG